MAVINRSWSTGAGKKIYINKIITILEALPPAFFSSLHSTHQPHPGVIPSSPIFPTSHASLSSFHSLYFLPFFSFLPFHLITLRIWDEKK
jgi:hypothetical protein